MQVQVQQVIPDGSVALGRGTDLETGDYVLFGGDWRPMRDIQAALEESSDVVADVPDWAVLNRVHPAHDYRAGIPGATK